MTDKSNIATTGNGKEDDLGVRPSSTVPRNLLDFRVVPLSVAKGAYGARLLPALNAVEVEDVAAVPKGNRQPVLIGRRRVGLVLNAWLVERVAANRARVGANVP